VSMDLEKATSYIDALYEKKGSVKKDTSRSRSYRNSEP
jgi:hypothetical protein